MCVCLYLCVCAWVCVHMCVCGRGGGDNIEKHSILTHVRSPLKHLTYLNSLYPHNHLVRYCDFLFVDEAAEAQES